MTAFYILATTYSLQGYLAHKKPRLPSTLQYDHPKGPMVALGGEAVSYERGTPVERQSPQWARETFSEPDTSLPYP